MSHRVLVTGSEGFVGRIVCAYLENEGYEVRGCDVLVPEGNEDRKSCNIAQSEEIEQLIEWCGAADYVLHLAAMTFVPEANRSPARVMEVNLNGAIRLATAVQRRWPDLLNWGPWLDKTQLSQAGLKGNRVSIPGDWDYEGVAA